jgi:hypothetical protein
VVRNVGPLSAPSPLAGDNISNRGLNVILCAPGAGASHFLKIRPASHAGFQREVHWTLHFAGHPETRTLVPTAVTFVEGPARVLAESYLEGTALDVSIRSGKRSAWLEVAGAAIALLKPIASALAGQTPADERGLAHLASLKRDLQLLCAVGLDPMAARALEACVEQARLPPVLQHGDFWPRNLLATQEGWKLIDFENVGEILLPLYDAFHMIRGCGEAAGETHGRWLESWASAGEAARPLTAAFRRVARELGRAEVEAALVAYLVDFAARLHRRGVSRERTASRLQELARVPSLLRAGLVQQMMEQGTSR